MEGSFYYEMGINRLRGAIAMFAVSNQQGRQRGAETWGQKNLLDLSRRSGFVGESVAHRVRSPAAHQNG